MSTDLQIRNIDDLKQLAKWYSTSSMAPKGDTPQTIAIKMKYALGLGIDPAAGVHSIYVINNKPTLTGKVALGLVQSHSQFAGMEQSSLAEIKETGKAWCKIRRNINSTISESTGEFSIEDAKRAGLWDKPGPWQWYPERMLLWRARSFAFDLFSDALCGLYLKEELESSTDFNEKPPAETPDYKVVKEPKNAFVASLAKAIQDCNSVDTLDNILIPKLKKANATPDMQRLLEAAVLRKEEIMTTAEDPAEATSSQST